MRLLRKTLLLLLIILEAFITSCGLFLEEKKKISQRRDAEREMQELMEQENANFKNGRKSN